eukprot:6214590-Amphidinium_carterae.1
MKQKKENEEKNLQQLSLSVKYVMSYGKPGLRKAFWKVIKDKSPAHQKNLNWTQKSIVMSLIHCMPRSSPRT